MNKYKHYAYRCDDPIELFINIDLKPDENPMLGTSGERVPPNAILIYEGDDKDALLEAVIPWFDHYQRLDDERKANEQAAKMDQEPKT